MFEMWPKLILTEVKKRFSVIERVTMNNAGIGDQPQSSNKAVLDQMCQITAL